MEYTEKFVKKKKKKNYPKNAVFTKKCSFHQKIGNQLKRTWHHMKAETLKKPCVKFEERRLNTLRENQICQKVNQKRATRPSAARLDITNNNRIFSSKNPAKNYSSNFMLKFFCLSEDMFPVANNSFLHVCQQRWLLGRLH